VSAGYNNGNYGGGAITNNGTVIWGSAIYTYGGVVIHNAGLWQTFGDYSLLTQAGTNSFINTGTFQKTAGAGSTTVTWPFTNAGLVKVQTGTLSLTDAAVQTAGSTLLNGGNLTVSQPFQLQGGTLAGINTVTGSVTNSGGVVSPGLSPGHLSISGSYTQAAGGALQIDLAGTSQGVTYDLLSVSSAAQLAGGLRIGLGAGFIPATNTTYTFLTASSRSGVFNGLVYPSNILGFVINYSASSVSLQITNVQSPPSPTTVFDPTIAGTNFGVCFSGDPGATYTIECSTNMSSTNWMKFTNIMGSFTDDGCGTGSIQLHDIISAAPSRFYRVVYPAY
jgi:hypothetical protein